MFRLWGIYLIIYFFPSRLGFLWVGPVKAIASLLGIDRPVPIHGGNGSGDGLYYYLQLPMILVIAVVVNIIWGLLNKRSGNRYYNTLFYYTWAIVRYTLGLYMLLYGFGKVVHGQFALPGPYRLIQTYGDSSLMGLAWTFLGASERFSDFTGWAEVFAGLLLFFRPTVKAGAAGSIAIMSVVVAMNFCYDIPVKIFSSHLLFAAFFVLAPELPRVLRFFFTNKEVPPSGMYFPVFESTGAKIAHNAIKTIVMLGALALLISTVTGKMYPKTYNEENVALYGLHVADVFVRNGDTLAPVITDDTRWRYLVVERNDKALVKFMNDSVSRYRMKIDIVERGITLTDKQSDPIYLHYKQSTDKKVLVLVGKAGNDSLYIMMNRKLPKDFLLINRGFHWINEYPLNR